MNILIASAEVTPLAKAGGLADVVGFLPVEWLKFGQRAIVMIPKYRSIDVLHYNFERTGIKLAVPMDYWTEYAELWSGKLPGTNVPVYLIDAPEYFDRPGIYGNPDGYLDNDRRFIFFSRAVFSAAKAINFYPDIIHAHDYHAAFTMPFLKTHYAHDTTFSHAAGVFTIHNLAYQGIIDPVRALKLAGFSQNDFFPGSWLEWHNAVNTMKLGIMFADKITTVSSTYANEIKMTEFGEGLQPELNYRGGDLIGILNGANYNEWNPETDKYLFKKYNLESIADKKVNKYELLKSYGLNESDNFDLPLVCMITRLAEQKGVDILKWKLEQWLAEGKMRFFMLGSGEKEYEDFFRYLNWKYPRHCLTYFGYNNELAHQLNAGADYLLMPSRFEPCGLTQMYALKYGTLPIVHQTGGLADTVREYNPVSGLGEGFSFLHYNADDMAYAVRRALEIYGSEPNWSIARKNAMNVNFSTAQSALEYLKVFNWALHRKFGEQ